MADSGREAPRDLTSTVVRGISLAAGGYLLAQALNLGFYVALARLLTPEEFGEFAAATILVAISLLISESGLASAVIQRRTRVEEAASTAAFATLAAGVVFSLLALAAAPLVGLFFDSDHVTALAAASAGTIFLRASGAIPDALLQRRFSFLRRLVVEPAQVLAFGIAAVLAASSDLGAWSLVIGQYAGFVVQALLSWILVRWQPSPRLASFALWRELAGYGRHVFVATAILHGGEQFSNAIVGRLLGTAALGQFRYALRLASTPYALLLAGGAYVLFPAFSRIAEEPARLQAAFLRSLRWICVLAFPAGLAFVPLGVPLAVIVFGDVWREAGEALVAMSLYPASGMLANIVSEALKAAGKPWPLTRMHSVTAVATAIAMIALQPFGLTAAAAGFTLGALIGGLYALRVMNRVLGTPIRAMVAEIWPPALAAGLGAVALLPLESLIDAESHPLALAASLLLAEAGVGALVYLLVLRLIAPETATQITDGGRALMRRTARFRGADPAQPEPETLDETLSP